MFQEMMPMSTSGGGGYYVKAFKKTLSQGTTETITLDSAPTFVYVCRPNVFSLTAQGSGPFTETIYGTYGNYTDIGYGKTVTNGPYIAVTSETQLTLKNPHSGNIEYVGFATNDPNFATDIGLT